MYTFIGTEEEQNGAMHVKLNGVRETSRLDRMGRVISVHRMPNIGSE